MRLTDEEVEKFERDGYLVKHDLFSPEEVEAILKEIPREFAQDSPRRIREKSGAVRSVFALHQTNEVFRHLTRLERLVEPAQQLLRGDVYVHQFKLNAKVALEGDQWEWHQDFLYWHKEDGMPAPRVLTATVFLQEVNEFNGPMLLIPGSHKHGMIDVAAQEVKAASSAAAASGNGAGWANTLTADLKYKIDRHVLADLLGSNDMYAAKGRAGFVLFFHGNLFHASAGNLSANDRMSIFVTYNSIENCLRDVEKPRPSFIASRDFSPVTRVPDESFLSVAGGRHE